MDFKPLLVKVKEAKPDLVYMISYVMDAALLMNQSMELRVMPKIFMGGGVGFTMPEFHKNAGKAANMVYSATLWYQTLPYPGAKEYYDKYMKKFNKETEYHGAEAYAAAYVIADTFKRAKSTSQKDVRQALSETDISSNQSCVRTLTTVGVTTIPSPTCRRPEADGPSCRRNAAMPNKEMKLTKPVNFGASQLNSSVGRTLGGPWR